MSKSKVNQYLLPNKGVQKERIKEALRILELNAMSASIEQFNKLANGKQITYLDFLENLLEIEFNGKEDNRRQRWVQQARFPSLKSLLNFDFSFQPNLKKQQISELASCRFIENAMNIVFFGQTGVGKTHLAIALGQEAINKGYNVRFTTLEDLKLLIEKVINNGEDIHKLFPTFLNPKLLILDEMHLYETNPTVTTFLCQLIMNRYERGSTIFTSNQTFKDWGNLFGNDSKVVSAILDRINHHCEIITIEGHSYRMKDKIK